MHRLYMAGTIKVWVMRSRWASCKNAAALNCGMMTSLPALSTRVVIKATKPVTWLKGTVATELSCGPKPMAIW